MKGEQWKPISGWEGRYSISSRGRIWSITRCRYLRPTLHPHGYLRVNLYSDKGKKAIGVHRLVALAFHGPQPSPAHEVNHKNCDKTDNHATNIEWATRSENQSHAYENGLRSAAGERNTNARLEDESALEIYRRRHQGESCSALAREYGISVQVVSGIARKTRWKHIHG